MNTPDKIEQSAAKLEAEVETLRRQAKQARDGQTRPGLKSQDLSPRTKLPVEHPESQAVERERYRVGLSLNSPPMTEAQADALLKEEKQRDE